MTQKLQKFLKKNHDIFWDTPHPEKLSIIKIQERFMQYGDWKNIIFLQNELGNDFIINYKTIRAKKRQNLPKKTRNFFDKYLHV